MTRVHSSDIQSDKTQLGYHVCEWQPENPAPTCRYSALKILGLKRIGEKQFVFTFLEGNQFCSCNVLPLISFILPAFHSSGTRASVCVTRVIINKPRCCVCHLSEWQQRVLPLDGLLWWEKLHWPKQNTDPEQIP